MSYIFHIFAKSIGNHPDFNSQFSIFNYVLSIMNYKINLFSRYSRFIAYFSETMPDATTELHYDSPFHLLVAVMLSAQCTDKRVNTITPALFEAYPTPDSLAGATEQQVLGYIHSVSYPNAKARHLVGMARMLCERFGGEVPSDRESLMLLPGVGRKTANVILSVIDGQSVMAVDTHVFRVSHRIGLVPAGATTPLAVERHLYRHISPELQPVAHHWLILHGRYVCRAARPLCDKCGLSDICRYYRQHKA